MFGKLRTIFTALAVAGCANGQFSENDPMLSEENLNRAGKVFTGVQFIANPVSTVMYEAPDILMKSNDLPPSLRNLSALVQPQSELTGKDAFLDHAPYVGSYRKDQREIEGNITLAKIMTSRYPDIPGFRHQTITLGDKNYDIAAIWAPTKNNPERVVIFSDIHQNEINGASGRDEVLRNDIRTCVDSIKGSMRVDIRSEVKGIDVSDHYKKLDALYEHWLDRDPPKPKNVSRRSMCSASEP